MLVVLAAIIILAAILIPVMLAVVVPRQQRSTRATSAVDCRQKLVCLNGGVTAFEGNVCRCICVRGFTGDRCQTAPSNACVTTSFRVDNIVLESITVGTAMPRLLRQGQSAFNVPLNVATVLSIFSSRRLTCSAANALVTFQGRWAPLSAAAASPTPSSSSRRQRRAVERRAAQAASSAAPAATTTTTPAAAAAAPMDTATIAAAPATTTEFAASTTAGIVVAAGSATGGATLVHTASDVAPLPGAATATSSTRAPTTPSPSPPSPLATPQPRLTTGAFVADDRALDFARVSMLFVLQHYGLDAAVAAQQRVESLLGAGNGGSTTVIVANEVGLDLQQRTLSFGNGTVVGGGGTGSITE